ncbi:creatininase family protein [Stratiformator vulcanicus]|uniref:Creatinine amidohydrolase n=1 Tax=Stratiformator vulcanicus TaxID=2527980 RepID=A0A517R5G3_9PLAN|nr:creatininase family protein [Stratiformator vulcanicus]QDT39137.1 Creatinine amidohydrolase [Stratiformator vulcanicus]
MKRSTPFLAEMTNRELEQFLEKSQTVIIPVGATEQHGPHSPIGTDVIIPQEIARRVAGEIEAVIAPSLAYTLSYPHRGFAAEFSVSIETFMAVIKDLTLSFAQSGFRKIVFLNGHFDNTYPIAYACAQAAEAGLPEGTIAFPINYWDGLTAEERDKYLTLDKGLHAGMTEVSAILAIDPELVDMEQANTEFPNFPETITESPAIHAAFFFTSPGSVYRITKTGTWGDATKATAEQGEEYLGFGVKSVLNLLADIDKTYAELPVR